jgi:TonB family protein
MTLMDVGSLAAVAVLAATTLAGQTKRGPGVPDTSVYLESQVEKQAAPLPTNRRPEYPLMHPLDLHGTVVVQVIVDTGGRVLPGSVEVISSPDALLTEPVVDYVRSMRFAPARANGHRVKERKLLEFSYPPPLPFVPSVLLPVD